MLVVVEDVELDTDAPRERVDERVDRPVALPLDDALLAVDEEVRGDPVGTALARVRMPDELERRRKAIRNALSQADRAVVRRSVERLAMLQLVEQGLHAGDILPDFALPDPRGQIVTGEMLLARGPLVLALFRGAWCPYCELAMRAVERARPAIEALGASVAGTMPAPPDELARVQDSLTA